MNSDDLTIQPPNPIDSLRDIRRFIEHRRISDALTALKLYGELERAYALAVMERQRYEVSECDS